MVPLLSRQNVSRSQGLSSMATSETERREEEKAANCKRKADASVTSFTPQESWRLRRIAEGVRNAWRKAMHVSCLR